MTINKEEKKNWNKRIRELVKGLIQTTQYSPMDVYESSGVKSGMKKFTSFQNWLSGNKDTTPENLKFIEDFYDSMERDIVPDEIKDIDHALYFAIVKDMNIRGGNRHFLANFLPGIYRVYKGSYFLPTKLAGIVIGHLRVFSIGPVLCVEEFQKYDARYGAREVCEEQKGYAFFKSNKVYMFTTEKNKPEHLQITTIDKAIRDSENYYYLEGVTFGTSLHLGTFNSRVVMERISDAQDEESFKKVKGKSYIRLVSEIEKQVNTHGYQEDKVSGEKHLGNFFLEFIRQDKTRDDVVTIW